MSWMSYITLWSRKTKGILLQVEPNTKLFPAVFVQPTNQNMVQLELGKLKVRNYFCSHTRVQFPFLKIFFFSPMIQLL